MTIPEQLENGGFMRTVAGPDFDALCQATALMYDKPNAGLMLMGATGCGKSLALRCLFPSTRTIYCQNQAKVRSLVPSDDQLYYRHTRETYDVVIDDLGADLPFNEYGLVRNVMSEFLEAWHYERVDRRRGGRLIVSTNLTANELMKRYDMRVFDRLMSSVVVCQMTGKSKREMI